MNDLFVILGLESWKPALTALVLPPVPLLVLILAGAALMRTRALGWPLLLAGVAGVWLCCTVAVGETLMARLVAAPKPLSLQDIAALRSRPNTAIVVLGAGRYLSVAERGGAALKPMSIERLRYGLWLGRETRLPVAFSGGVGHRADAGPSEAELATRIAADEYRLPLRWAEGRSRDTNENARYTVPLLKAEGIERIVLVTHGFHMRRALADFERAIGRESALMTLTPAPMGLLAPSRGTSLGDWLPTAEGFAITRLALREWLGRLAGA